MMMLKDVMMLKAVVMRLGLERQRRVAVLLTGLNTIQVIRSAVISGMAAVVLIRDKRPSPEMVDQAREHGLPLLSSPFTMFSSCGRLFAKGLRGVEGKDS